MDLETRGFWNDVDGYFAQFSTLGPSPMVWMDTSLMQVTNTDTGPTAMARLVPGRKIDD